MNVTMRSSIEKAYGLKLPLSYKMEDNINLWRKMYEDEPLWISDGAEPIGLPASISGEIARLVTMDMDCAVSGSPMAEYLNGEFQRCIANAKEYTEVACALGGIILKPYYCADKGTIEVSVVHADEFYPTRIYNRKIIGGIFPDQVTINDYKYTRLERHELVGNNYLIQNKCFVRKVVDSSDNEYSLLGDECALSNVPEWASLQPEMVIRNVKTPLFAYFKMPLANNIEKHSPLGVSVFSRAVKRIKRADSQWANIVWEFDATQAAVFGDDDLFIHSPTGGLAMDKKSRRLYRSLDGFQKQLETFTPAIRDVSLINGLQTYLREIEFQCNLAYGTLSDPSNVDKTAEEVKASKQRSFSFVVDVQTAFENAHRELIEAMHTLAILYIGIGDGNVEVKFDFDDSIAVNRSEAFSELMQMASAKMIRPEYVVSWYFGISKDEAIKMLPPAFDDTMEFPPAEEE